MPDPDGSINEENEFSKSEQVIWRENSKRKSFGNSHWLRTTSKRLSCVEISGFEYQFGAVHLIASNDLVQVRTLWNAFTTIVPCVCACVRVSVSVREATKENVSEFESVLFIDSTKQSNWSKVRRIPYAFPKLLTTYKDIKQQNSFQINLSLALRAWNVINFTFKIACECLFFPQKQ